MLITSGRVAGVVLALTALVSATACGNRGADNQAEAASSADYFFDQAIKGNRNVDAFYSPTLLTSLPNHTSVVDAGGRVVSGSPSDALVIGTVSEVEHGEAVAYDDNRLVHEEPVPIVLDWHDPRVAARDLVVTLEPTENIGSTAGQKAVSFRLNIAPGADPDRYEAAVRSLGTAAVLLMTTADRGHPGELVPARGLTGIGVIDGDGRLTFPAMGKGQAEFLGDLDTLDELVDAAKGVPVIDRMSVDDVTP